MVSKANKALKRLQDIKTQCLQRNWSRVLMFLFFIVVSLGFWTLQSLQQLSDAQFNLPILYTNLPQHLALHDSVPQKLRVKTLDKGITLLGYSLNIKDKVIVVDLESVTPDQSVYTVPPQWVEAECLKALPSTAKLISYSPVNLQVKLLPLQEKRVPVRFQGSLVPAANAMITEPLSVYPKEITVYGPAQVVDTLTAVYTQIVVQENIKETQKIKVELLTPLSVSPKQTTVEVVVQVEECTEKHFTLPIVAKGFPKNIHLRTFPPTVQITCRLPLSAYQSVTEDAFEAVVYYESLRSDTTSTLPVVIEKSPLWTENYLRYSPDKVEFLLEQKQHKYD